MARLRLKDYLLRRTLTHHPSEEAAATMLMESLLSQYSMMGVEGEAARVWYANVGTYPPRTEAVHDVLSDAERRRADRFRFERDRRCYMAGRGMLRVVLGQEVACDPARLRFGSGTFGKPFLAEPGGTDVQFNVSHAHDLVAVVIARGQRVGIDVEYVRDLDNMDGLARRFFSAQEYATLQSLAPEQRPDAFFRCWTRKEAYVKARGDGLTLPLDRFDVSLRPGEPAALLHTRPDPSEADRWSLRDLRIMVGYQAALALEAL